MNCLSTFVLISKNINISTYILGFGYWKEYCRIICELLTKMGKNYFYIIFQFVITYILYGSCHVIAVEPICPSL